MKSQHYLGLLLSAVAVLCSLLPQASSSAYEYEALENWIIEEGGMVKTRVGINKDGYRGLFSKVSAKTGEYLATVPSTTMLNCGALDSSVTTGALTVLRELLDPHTRFKEYIKVWPKRGEIMNVCTLPVQYLPLLESDYWARAVNASIEYLRAALAGEVNGELDYTVKEMVGSAPVTLEDMQYACAVASTRYVTVELRKRLMMVPIFDMKNHKRLCKHTTSALDADEEIHLIAGHDVEPGDELCYDYHPNMRDDYGLMNYGFIPDAEDPPRLLQIDHHQFDPAKDYQDLTEDVFTGPVSELRAELARQQATLDHLTALDAKKDPKTAPPKGSDWVYDNMMELQRRRRAALRYEINRLKSELMAHGEL